ncbi:MAG: sugar phosphate isomerase/epimerase [Ruminococcaceae bacterium]|nr:sugar phosphate isomerase/epimerase [Oscillospiraceae bacterium]
MYRHILCMNTSPAFGVSLEEQIVMLGKTGFEGFFTPWYENCPMDLWAKTARDNNMIYQSVHAPFGGVKKLWHGQDDEADIAEKELVDCVHDCSDNGIGLMISHCYIGFDSVVDITQKGLERYGRIIEEAQKCGVNIAFENTEGEEYLAAVLDNFGNNSNVGFCLDTGHELCYNYGKDLLSLWGDKLIATHINDNLGIKDRDGKIFWHDDLHLLPFDGIRDWDETASRLKNCGYKGILTFELNKSSKPERHENDVYEKMSLQEYFTQCYIRACRFAAKL